MLLAEIATYLASQSLGLTGGVNLFYGKMQEEFPDDVTVIFEYGGEPDEPTLGDPPTFGKAVRLEYPRIQILCRGSRDTYDGPRITAEAIRIVLVKVVNMTLSGVRYLSIESKEPPFRLREDENFRTEIVSNYKITKEMS